MTRISAVVLAALLVIAAPASVAGSAGGAAGDAGNRVAAASDAGAISLTSTTTTDGISWIAVDGSGASEHASAGPDIGRTLLAEDAALRSQFAAYETRNRLEAATTDAERQEILRAAVADLEEKYNRLHEREHEAVRAYSEGDVSKQELLGEIVAIRGESRSMSNTLDRLADRSNNDSIDTRIVNLRGRLARFDTPVRADIAAAMSGESDRIDPIRVTASENQLVLAIVDGTTYDRESVQYDRYAPGEPTQFDNLIEVGERMGELYPWINQNSRGSYNSNWHDTLMSVSADHSKGSLVAFIDGSTREVVLEHHRVDIETLPTTSTVRQRGENVSIAAHRVPNGGPVYVNVTDTETDEPLEANVSVGGEYNVSTGPDGTAWIPAPKGDVVVTATVGANASGAPAEERISVTVIEPSG